MGKNTKYVKTTIRLNEKLARALKAAKRSEGFDLSPFVRDQLERKFFGDPNFIQDQIESNENLIHELTEINKKLQQEKLDVVERITKRKERIKELKPVIRRYGELVPKNKRKGGTDGSSD